MFRKIVTCGSVLTASLSLALAAGVATSGVASASSPESGASQACTASGNLIVVSPTFSYPSTHGGCVAGNLPVDRQTSAFTSYCGLYSYPGYVYDPVAQQNVYFNTRGDCVSYVNATYKTP